MDELAKISNKAIHSRIDSPKKTNFFALSSAGRAYFSIWRRDIQN